ncbi:MAG: hypothetical protein IJB83_01700 [Bacilli bacterium]|nr:hypothetical protein [Bacilli bacterium]
MKKTLIIFILISITAIILKYCLSNYEINYKVAGYNIKTTYKNQRYYFELSGKYTYNFDIYKNRTIKKPIIKQIKTINGNDFECIYPVINDLETYPLCTLEGEITDYHLIDDEQLNYYKKESIIIDKTNSTFDYYNNLDQNTYIALWNYKGYIIMNGKDYTNIELFEKDKYDNTLSHQIENKIYMPNYNQEHEYNELIELDIKAQTKNIIKLEYEIDYDSYIVGNIKNKLYIFDNKYDVLYEIDIKKQKTIIKSNNEKGYTKYSDGEFVPCSKIEYKINKIKYEKTKDSHYKYETKEGLYKTINENKNIKTKISNDEVLIQNEYQNELYYINNNYLYRYTPLKGSEKILFFFELNFNKDKTIYIYNE